ncbi:MAG TPA: rod shape-determining protein [Vicinamibacterales bacterium]|jgi:rod shape-determining protein MreB and related proteins|nr:rod shape-determining protein [Vicinamibacterales bacterium]
MTFAGLGHDLAIDLGTANTCVFALGKGVIISEPSLIAFNTSTGAVEAVGEHARGMLGRTPDRLRPVRPIRDGVIADFDATEKMLSYFIKKTNEQVGGWTRPRVVFGVPSQITPVERRAVKESAYRAKVSEVYLVDEPMAAALGAGLPITEPAGSMIIDIGGGTTDIAVISLSGVVISKSVRVAGDAFDESIIQHLKRRHEVLIGERTAEDIKLQIGSATKLDKPLTMEVKGRHIGRGVPVKVTVCDTEIREALGEPLKTIINAVRETLDQIPPELSADIFDRGVALCGGTVLLRNLDRRLRQETQLPVKVVDQPLSAVVVGAGKMLEDKKLLKRLAA